MWIEKENALHATCTFENFTAAFTFMTQIAFVAAAHNHHPNWSNVYNKVEFRLTTHDAGNTVTEKDWALARAIEQRYEQWK